MELCLSVLTKKCQKQLKFHYFFLPNNKKKIIACEVLSTGPDMSLAFSQLLLKVEERKELRTSSRFLKWTTYWNLLLFSHQVVSNSLRPYGLQHTRPPRPSSSPGVCPTSCPLNRWCHPTISSSVALFSFCLQSFPASGSFPMSQNWEYGPRNRLEAEDNKCSIRHIETEPQWRRLVELNARSDA